MFQLYEEMIRQDVIFYKVPAWPLAFKNMVTLGIKLDKLRWAEMVIKKYGPYLPEPIRQGVINFNLANLHFVKKEYSEAQKLLLDVDMIDSYSRLNYDLLLLKIFYENGEMESLLSRIRAFTVYIQRNKSISDQNKEAYLNLARLLKRFARYRYDHIGKYESVVAQYEATQYLVERNWLHEKLEELK